MMATRTKTTSHAEPKGKEYTAHARGKLAAKSPSKTKAAASGGVDMAYLALIQRFPLRPIHTEAELDAASAIIDELTNRNDLSSSEFDYLDVLGDLVEKYEDEHVEMPSVSDPEMLRSLMDEKGSVRPTWCEARASARRSCRSS